MKCDQCQALMINGTFCHETGCPNQRKTWDAEREQWITYVACGECGCEVEVGERCDCQDEDPDESPFCADVRCSLPADHAGPCEEEKE